MRQLVHKCILLTRIAFLKRTFLFKKNMLGIKRFFIYIKEFFHAIFSIFPQLRLLTKVSFVFCLIIIVLGSTFLFGRAYSQTIDNNIQVNGQTSSIPANYVQDEMLQLFTFVNQAIGGTTDTKTGNHNGGLIDAMDGVEAYLYTNNPISITGYAQYYAQSHDFIKPTYAQAVTGSGYNTLSPVIPIWEIARNLCYILIAVMTIVIGFIILFGGKYGQSEVTIISSLPKIFIAIVLITFSFPIAGVAFDIANLGTNVIVNLLGPQFVQPNAFFPGQYPVKCDNNIPDNVSSDSAGLAPDQTHPLLICATQGAAAKGLDGDFNVFRLISPILTYSNWAQNNKGSGGSVFDVIQTPTNIGLLDGLLTNIPLNTTLGSIANFSLNLIINGLVFFVALRIFAMIITSFARIVAATMMGPFTLVSYPLEGNAALWNFAKSLLAPALIFPAVFGMLFIAAIFAFGTDCVNTVSQTNQPCAQSQFTNPTTTNPLGQVTTNPNPWYINNNNNITNFGNGPALFVDTINPKYTWNIFALVVVIAIPGIAGALDEFFKNQLSRSLQQEFQRAGGTFQGAGQAGLGLFQAVFGLIF